MSRGVRDPDGARGRPPRHPARAWLGPAAVASLLGACAVDVPLGDLREGASAALEVRLVGFERHVGRTVVLTVTSDAGAGADRVFGTLLATGRETARADGVLRRGRAETLLAFVDAPTGPYDVFCSAGVPDRAWRVPLGIVRGDVTLTLAASRPEDPSACGAFPLPGDYDRSGCVDEDDAATFTALLDAGDARGDLNLDGVADIRDLNLLTANLDAARGCAP